MKRIKLPFIMGLEVEFADRDRGLKQIKEFAERGTWYPIVVFGPEGCGKTSWLRAGVEILRDLGFSVIYFNPLRRDFLVEVGIKSVEERALEILKHASTIHILAGFIGYVIDFARDIIKLGKEKIAVIVDDVFELTGVQEASLFVKGMLELIEHPPEKYEKIVAIAATSEGFSRREIGKHRWAELRSMWNMSKRGFRELYEEIPGFKLEFEDVWRLTGGNPDVFRKLYQADWSIERVIHEFIVNKEITRSFIEKWRSWLEIAIEDPDSLWGVDIPSELIEELISKNLIVYNMYSRDPWFWIDEPPLERDLELGIGKYIAWQSPLHREAVRRALIIQ